MARYSLNGAVGTVVMRVHTHDIVPRSGQAFELRRFAKRQDLHVRVVGSEHDFIRRVRQLTQEGMRVRPWLWLAPLCTP